MAIGLALMLNIVLPENFDSPYQARSIIDFWRRWHMTLSNFLRDYLYVPLGGNRRGGARRYVNLFITMLLGGPVARGELDVRHLGADCTAPSWRSIICGAAPASSCRGRLRGSSHSAP